METRVKLLLVEDNEADVELTQAKLKSCKLLHELFVVRDGEEAMDFVCHRPPFESAPRPDLILLDLNLPRKSGREVLHDIKSDPTLRRIPVVVLTSSTAEADILRSYDLQASAYVTKPVDLTGFGKIARAIEDFWIALVRYPPE